MKFLKILYLYLYGNMYGNMLIQMFQTLHEISKKKKKKELVSKIHKFYITIREAQTPSRKNGQGIFHRRGDT